MNRKTIAFIGGGNMGEAIISKMVSSDWKGNDIHVIDHNEEKLERLSSEYGVHAHKEPGSWLSEIDAVVLAVKPQQLAEAIKASKMDRRRTRNSIAAGVRVKDLEAMIGHNCICRTMPNTPMENRSRRLRTLFHTRSRTRPRFIVKVFAACGDLIWCTKEEELDGVTAISGSGPAYVFRFIEALTEAGLRYGFNDVQAKRMAIATVLGSAELAKRSGESPSVLREKVTSKGGTTYEALKVMNDRHFMEMMQDAMDACKKRAVELGDAFHESVEAAEK